MRKSNLTLIYVLFLVFSITPLVKADNLNSTPQSIQPKAEKKSKHVCSTSNRGEARCHLHVVIDDSGKPLVTSGPVGYGPTQFHIAYTLPSQVNTPTTIAIVDAYDSPTIEQDLNVYNQTYGLASCTTANNCFKKVNQYGQQYNYPSTNNNWALEISLDVEIAHAICQNCQILLVEAQSASFSDLVTAEDTAAKLGATVISNSYGGSEFSSETSLDSHFNHPGVMITASSGDNGYGVEYPAASQYVTAVGGTTLKLNTNYTRNSETAWSGAGSGCSAYETKPSWQKDTACIKRTVTDISADADPNTGAAIYDSTGTQSGWYQVGGTSLSAPLIAAVYALAGNSRSVTYGSYPYSQTPYLYDVQSGSNGTCGNYLCTGGTGYDGPSGLGTPIGINGF